MQGVGELFGRSVDAVLRRPRAAIAPFAVDVLWLLLGTGLFAAVGFELLFPQGYRLPNFPVAVPHALPTVGDVMGPQPAIHGFGPAAVVAASILILLGIPLLAFAEAGFLGVLRAVYLTPHDPTRAGIHVDAWVRIRSRFVEAGRAHGATFLVLRGIQALLALVALGLPALIPAFSSYGLGILAVDVLLLYAPYAAVESRRAALEGARPADRRPAPFRESARVAVAAIRESVQLVSDHLATTLVALLFGFLLTGGIGYLAARAAGPLGPAGPFVFSALYAPVGTLLALFLYRVYLGFYPEDVAPETAAAPVAVPA